MGLQELDGMDTPDNKGGRPSKDEQEESYGRSAEGDPLTRENNNENWWRVQFHQLEDNHDTTDEVIQELADHISVSPVEVRLRLEEHEIHETDWEWYIEEYSMYENDMRVRHKLEEADIVPEKDTTSETDSGETLFGDLSVTEDTSSKSDDVSGGLSSLIDE